jgi:hypothetical protein
MFFPETVGAQRQNRRWSKPTSSHKNVNGWPTHRGLVDGWCGSSAHCVRKDINGPRVPDAATVRATAPDKIRRGSRGGRVSWRAATRAIRRARRMEPHDVGGPEVAPPSVPGSKDPARGSLVARGHGECPGFPDSRSESGMLAPSPCNRHGAELRGEKKPQVPA